MELAPIEEFAEDQRDLLFDDPRPVVLNRHAEPTGLWLIDFDPNLREYPCLLTSIQGVIHSLLDGRQKGFAWIVEAQ
jgi:hypothetical protein